MARREKSVFGEYLVQQIKEAGMTQESFYTAVGIAKPYFYDLITAAPPPPELQNRMLTVLESKTGKNVARRNRFLNLAAMGRDEVPADINDILKANCDNWDAVRSALNDLFAPTIHAH